MTKDDVADYRGRPLCETNNGPPLSSTVLNDTAYRPFLDDLSMSEEQKSDLMRIVWDIMRMWVEMDIPAESCGQILNCLLDPEAPDSAHVE